MRGLAGVHALLALECLLVALVDEPQDVELVFEFHSLVHHLILERAEVNQDVLEHH